MKTIMRITRICANTANDDANKNKLKTQKSKVKSTSQKSKVDIVPKHRDDVPNIH